MYSIGEFSKITGFSVKALRIYQEKEILLPDEVDTYSGYRYYSSGSVERARIVSRLKEMEFSLGDIADIIHEADDDSDLIIFLEKQREVIARKLARHQKVLNTIDQIVQTEKEARMAHKSSDFVIEEKEVETRLMAGVRYSGKYSDCGEKFGLIGKKMGFSISGKPFCLYYNDEYREDDAEIEACMPVRKGKSGNGIDVRELPGGKAVTLIHKGPFDTLGNSYEKIFEYINTKGLKKTLPFREVYLKGPGMIFKGDERNYLTEIQILVES